MSFRSTLAGAGVLLALCAPWGMTARAVGSCSLFVPPLALTSGPGNSGSSAMSVGEIGVDCPRGETFRLKIGPSAQGGGGGFSPRRMLWNGGSATLSYNLYLDPAGARIWGDGSGRTQFFQGAGKGVRQSIPVYGRLLPQRPFPREGAYSDSLLVTIEY